MHTSFLLHKEILQTALTLRELAPSPYFFLIIYLIDINVSAEIDEYPLLRFQNIRKPKCYGRTDNLKTKFAGI